MYESIVDQMKSYEQLKLIDWTNKARLLAVCQMNSNILVCIRTQTNTDQSHSESNLLKIEDLKDWLKCSRKSNQILYDSKLMFKTNFNDQVYELIEEAEMMENLGIVLPGEMQMLLAKKNSLLDDIMKVKNVVNTYNTFISSMSNLEVSFL
ncbi:uncharacterized protein LOC132918070 [Rhopalosiphum padi]|uniref:uncharacterized protein LOC132918070 n=1 Tax=Rhopalosiphum padi TaxID=40932 RepID=UPI00298E7678|nr:uncharacterized protein LOC132918070 [Rhopalosiphum padi]